MSAYLIKATYTPNDPDADRRRKGCVIETEAGVLDAITGALSTLEMSGLHDDVIREYLDDIGDEDTSEGWAWEVGTNNGEWHFEWEPFDPADPVTKENLLAWARREAGPMIGEDGTDEELHSFLVCILGRLYWRNIDEWSSHDLKETLHEMVVMGGDSKPYSKMTVDELLDTIMEEAVEYTAGCYDAVRHGKPFGMATMIAEDTRLWLDEDKPRRVIVERQDLEDNDEI